MTPKKARSPNTPRTKPAPTRTTADDAPKWTDWRPLPGIAPLTPRVLAEILDGGQSFRWRRIFIPTTSPASTAATSAISTTAVPITYEGIWADNIAQLTLDASNTLHWRAPRTIAATVAIALPCYLATDTDFDALARALGTAPIARTTRPRDHALANAIKTFRGLRILRQPFGETLLGFICSATKQIPQIKQMLALLAERHGTDIAATFSSSFAPDASSSSSLDTTTRVARTHRRLPTWPELATLTETQLRACKLGFRARHIHNAALAIATLGGERWLEETEHLPYPEAKARLIELPGVGEKIADCVLLFGAGRLEAFPIDTWIRRALLEYYPTALHPKMNNHQLLAFARERFNLHAGLAEQYLFAYIRATKHAS